MYAKPGEPDAPDHYSTLGISPDATDDVIKKAFRKLALKFHPDKQAPGQTVDAVEFRKVREAYEVLIDPEQRDDYDLQQPDIQGQWEKYRRDVDDWQRRSAAEAEAEAEQARSRTKVEEQERRGRVWDMGQREKARRAAVERESRLHDLYGYKAIPRCYCRGCAERKHRERYERQSGLDIPAPEEYAEYKQMKAEDAERRSREAMRKRREEQEREAWKRVRKEEEKMERIKKAEERKRASKAKVKDERSKETARRAREQQEKDAHLRMAKAHVKMQQDNYLSDLRGTVPSSDEVVIDIGWTKKKGIAKCLFCEEEIKYYSFRCPDGGAIACNPCKNNMCRFTPPKKDEVEYGEEVDITSEEDSVDLESVAGVAQDEEHGAGDHETKAEGVPDLQNGHVQDREHGAGTQEHVHHETEEHENEDHEAETDENEGYEGANHETNNATMHHTKIAHI